MHSLGCVGIEQIRSNAAQAKHLPVLEKQDWHDRPLAVVGGGRSASLALNEIRAWPGDVWAINGACQWLASEGIEATLFSVDPEDVLAPLAVGAKKAILASHCDPKVFQNLDGAEVVIFHTPHIEGISDPVLGGTSTACYAPSVAIRCGYRSVTFFGCEGSFVESTHSYKSESPSGQVVIRAGGLEHRASVQMMMQSEHLSALIREFPSVFKERSGGLLRAMIEYPDSWEVVALSGQLAKSLIGDHALSEMPAYELA
jgi:hypothetical protein